MIGRMTLDMVALLAGAGLLSGALALLFHIWGHPK